MKKRLLSLLVLAVAFPLFSCESSQSNIESNNTANSNDTANEDDSQNNDSQNQGDTTFDSENTLIAYFSRTGESYDGSTITTGNVHTYAGYLQQLLPEADVYRIEPETSYPTSYDEMIAVARDEWSSDARPAISSPLTSIEEYDTILLGYPIWNGHAPRIIYSFLDSFDFEGKTILPFACAGSSSMNGSVSELEDEYPDYDFTSGLRITDNQIGNEESCLTSIQSWLEENYPTTVETVSQSMYLEYDDKRYQVLLEDNASVRDLLSRLPLTLSFSDYASSEKIAYLDEELEVEESGAEAHVGELNYYAPWGNLCLFYAQGTASSSLVRIGTLQSGIEDFASIDSDFEMTLTL